MARLRLSTAARHDLERIADEGLRDHGPAVSTAYMEGFRRLFRLLVTQPLAGQERPEFQRGLRSLSHRPYRILYQTQDDMVQIVRIIHQSRDVRQALRKRR